PDSRLHLRPAAPFCASGAAVSLSQAAGRDIHERPRNIRMVSRRGQDGRRPLTISHSQQNTGTTRTLEVSMPMHPRERMSYSAIEGRAPLKFPDGVRMVIWPVLALEEWDMSRPMARMVISPPQGQPMLPDHPNWSW